MSWTSEFETPPSRPPKSSGTPEADPPSSDDGPLDPSVFDGLFADLDKPGETEADAAPGDEGADQEETHPATDENEPAPVEPETAESATGPVESDLFDGYQDGADIEGFESVAEGGDVWGLETTGWSDVTPDTTGGPATAEPPDLASPTTPEPNGDLGLATAATGATAVGVTETDIETVDLEAVGLETIEPDALPETPSDTDGFGLVPTDEPPLPPPPPPPPPPSEADAMPSGDAMPAANAVSEAAEAEDLQGHQVESETEIENGAEEDAGLTTLDPTQAGFATTDLAEPDLAEMTVHDVTLPAEPTTNAQDGRWMPADDDGEEPPAEFEPADEPTQHETVFEAATEPTFAPLADATPPGIDPEHVIDLNLTASPTDEAVTALDFGHGDGAGVGTEVTDAMIAGGDQGFHPATETGEAYPPPPATTGRSRRWPSFLGAILVGALLGGALALVLYQLVGRSDQSEEATTTTAPISDETTAAPTETSADVTQPVVNDPAVSGRLDLNSIRFRRGTTDLTPGSIEALDQLAEAMVEVPGLPLLVVVRSYSEPLAADNLALSQAQAVAVIDHLAGAGADVSSARASGIGTSPLSSRQPVQNFVIVDPGFGEAGLSDVMADASPFAIGIDPTTSQLRPESLPYLERLGEALNADPDLRIGLAGYAFDQLDPAGNRQLAGAAVEAVTGFLSTQASVDQDRVSTLSLADAQFIVPQRAGNHISIQWGDHVGPAAELAALDQGSITFEAGTDRLTADAILALDQAAEIMADADGTIVIDAHAYAGTDREANQELSELRAAATARYLVETGVPAERIRAYGSGSSRQFRDGSSDGRFVLSFIPR